MIVLEEMNDISDGTMEYPNMSALGVAVEYFFWLELDENCGSVFFV
jgi:hypothetical protein